MRKYALASVLLALPWSADAQTVPEASLTAMRNCMWSQTVNKAHEISRRMSLGVNVAADLALSCGEPMGVRTYCEESGGSPDTCMALMIEEGNAAILREYKRYADTTD